MKTHEEREAYWTDLSNEEWLVIGPLVPAVKEGGRPADYRRREIVNAILYLNRTGCAWRLLPHDLPPYRTVFAYFSAWQADGTWERIEAALRDRLRRAAGKKKAPTAAIVDSQSVKMVDQKGARGRDNGKQVTGRKRHLLVDTLGLILALKVTAADVTDHAGARLVLAKLLTTIGFGWVKTVWADSAYHVYALYDWIKDAFRGRRLKLEIVSRSPAQKGFAVQKWRWVVERTFGCAQQMSAFEQRLRSQGRTQRGHDPCGFHQLHAASTSLNSTFWTRSEDLRKKGREANEARDPYGFGTSFGGRASTVATKLAQPLVNLANDPFGIDKEEREKLQMDLATKTAVSQEREIRMKISEGIRADLSMVRDRLSGDRADAEILGLQLARTRAIKEAEQNSKYISPADRQRIAAGFDLQIKAAREQQEADSKRFMQSAAALGLQSSTLTTLQKQVKAQYAVIAAAKDELATRTMITAERRRELQLTIMGPQGELRNERREKMFGKTEGQIRKELLQEKKTRKKVEKFDAKQDRNDGLVDIHRGMNDEILSGVDPLTGERRKPSAGYRPPTRLETGGLETGNLRTMDDRTPSPFDDNMPAARDPAVRLMNPSGSGFGNPADRLNNPEGSGFGNPTDRLNRGRAGHPFDPDIMRGPQASSHFSGGASMAAAAQVAVLNSHTPFLQYLPKIADMMDKMRLG